MCHPVMNTPNLLTPSLCAFQGCLSLAPQIVRDGPELRRRSFLLCHVSVANILHSRTVLAKQLSLRERCITQLLKKLKY
ncbi:hypothetical protein CC80DRAFT_327872 [Byssothecium circinans]|uniref:Uncharacterized protein n=1 Tax=Byssothecium circinans TaxID=147558 RepID=A0A6A5T932_9PLEO|nr:hypothetical protein CC80DRAFT_327872 [Byssothecium circinans]